MAGSAAPAMLTPEQIKALVVEGKVPIEQLMQKLHPEELSSLLHLTLQDKGVADALGGVKGAPMMLGGVGAISLKGTPPPTAPVTGTGMQGGPAEALPKMATQPPLTVSKPTSTYPGPLPRTSGTPPNIGFKGPNEAGRAPRYEGEPLGRPDNISNGRSLEDLMEQVQRGAQTGELPPRVSPNVSNTGQLGDVIERVMQGGAKFLPLLAALGVPMPSGTSKRRQR